MIAGICHPTIPQTYPIPRPGSPTHRCVFCCWAEVLGLKPRGSLCYEATFPYTTPSAQVRTLVEKSTCTRSPRKCSAIFFQRYCLRARTNKLLCTSPLAWGSLKQAVSITSSPQAACASTTRLLNSARVNSDGKRTAKRSTATSVGAD